ncbi:head-tail connector protein [Ructibacterium gallinarum]|uniref:Phage head-tail connector protein n=1 Tax=Ructibacterium gallinarum TaxID=2779355 RepID=A0A9D5R8C2_9FIRM|nr:head-tail connector protein [Ructibacterium gallinarum]MBE5039820.1 phage head-tail connector protein [Ructibacterium gallinarum]
MLSLDTVKEFLRIDHNEEDGYLSVLLLLAKELCENYLRISPLDDEKECIRQAQLLVISHFYERRDGTPVPSAVYRLLDAYRNEVF